MSDSDPVFPGLPPIPFFMLFYFLRERAFPGDVIRTMLFLKLIIAGHSTSYVTGTTGSNIPIRSGVL
jgi:hypothetical protein